MLNFLAVLLGLSLPMVLIALGLPQALTGAIVIATTLVWPGYVMTLLLWPLPNQLNLAQRWSFMPLFSLLVLGGISLFTWVVLQAATPIIIYGLTNGATLFALVVAHKTVRQLKWQEVAGAWAICVIFGALVASAAAMPAGGPSALLFPEQDKPSAAFTEFYAVTESAPREAIAGELITATIGIANHEGVATHYTVAVKSNDEVIGASPIISLEDSETWQRPIGFTLPFSGDNQKIEFILEREGHPEPYRTLQLRVNVKPKPTVER